MLSVFVTAWVGAPLWMQIILIVSVPSMVFVAGLIWQIIVVGPLRCDSAVAERTTGAPDICGP